MQQKRQATDIPLFDCPYPKCAKMISKQEVEKYLNAEGGPNMSFGCCPTPDCPFVFQTPDLKSNKAWTPKFECPVCEAVYCMKCKKDFHFGRECEGQSNGGMQQQKKCSKCGVWVVRKEN